MLHLTRSKSKLLSFCILYRFTSNVVNGLTDLYKGNLSFTFKIY